MLFTPQRDPADFAPVFFRPPHEMGLPAYQRAAQGLALTPGLENDAALAGLTDMDGLVALARDDLASASE